MCGLRRWSGANAAHPAFLVLSRPLRQLRSFLIHPRIHSNTSSHSPRHPHRRQRSSSGHSSKLHREDISWLGIVVQTNQIGALKRTDYVHRRVLVTPARASSKKKVKVLLKRTSLVPTIVCIVLLAFLVSWLITELSCPECLQRAPLAVGFRFYDTTVHDIIHEDSKNGKRFF